MKRKRENSGRWTTVVKAASGSLVGEEVGMAPGETVTVVGGVETDIVVDGTGGRGSSRGVPAGGKRRGGQRMII